MFRGFVGVFFCGCCIWVLHKHTATVWVKIKPCIHKREERMQIVWVLDNTERIHPADSASGVFFFFSLQHRNRFIPETTVEILWGYKCQWGEKSSFFSPFFKKKKCTPVWMCLGLDARQWEFVWACLSLALTGICKWNIRVLAVGRNACRQQGELSLGALVRHSPQHLGELEWLWVGCCNAFSREASVTDAVFHRSCGSASNISAPQAWSTVMVSPFPRPSSLSSHNFPFHSPMLLTWWRVHQGQQRAQGQIYVCVYYGVRL